MENILETRYFPTLKEWFDTVSNTTIIRIWPANCPDGTLGEDVRFIQLIDGQRPMVGYCNWETSADDIQMITYKYLDELSITIIEQRFYE